MSLPLKDKVFHYILSYKYYSILIVSFHSQIANSTILASSLTQL